MQKKYIVRLNDSERDQLRQNHSQMFRGSRSVNDLASWAERLGRRGARASLFVRALGSQDIQVEVAVVDVTVSAGVVGSGA